VQHAGCAWPNRSGGVHTATPMGKRVLIVDDDRDSRDALRELVRIWGHEAEVAADGCEAITLALERRPDVVLLDLGLPDLHGQEVARRISSGIGRDRPYIIALSGSDEDKSTAPAGVFDAYIVKPAEADALHAIIERVSAVTTDERLRRVDRKRGA